MSPDTDATPPDESQTLRTLPASTYIAGMSVIEELGSPFAAKTRSSLLVGREPGLKDGAQHCPLHPSGPDERSTAGTRRVRISSHGDGLWLANLLPPSR